MSNDPLIDSSVKLLIECDGTVDELEAKCCTPTRSPSMVALRDTIMKARERVESLDSSSASVQATISDLAYAGAQIGRLQVTCCAPARMPLYDTLSHNLMQVQRALTRYAKLDH